MKKHSQQGGDEEKTKESEFFSAVKTKGKKHFTLYMCMCVEGSGTAATVAAQARKKKVFIKPTAECVLKPTAGYMRQKTSNGPQKETGLKIRA